MSASAFPRQESEIDNAQAQNTSTRRCGPFAAAKNYLDLDHGLSRFLRPNAPGIILCPDKNKNGLIKGFLLLLRRNHT